MHFGYIILIIGASIFLLFILYNILTRRFVNPYTLEIYFGKKGCGKSVLLQKLARKYYKHGWHVFCNENDTILPFVQQIKVEQLYRYKLPVNSVVLIDEVNLLWDNRSFQSFPKEMQEYFRMQRHKRVKVIMFSQTYDCDLKIRNLADRLYLVNKFARIFSISTAYVKKPTVLSSEQTHTEGRISDDFIKLPFWTKQITFIPKYIKSYDSYYDDNSKYVYDFT